MAWRSSVRKDPLPRAQQDRIDGQQDMGPNCAKSWVCKETTGWAPQLFRETEGRNSGSGLFRETARDIPWGERRSAGENIRAD
jgi:hypothetical protein